jgi:hypothetical protein
MRTELEWHREAHAALVRGIVGPRAIGYASQHRERAGVVLCCFGSAVFPALYGGGCRHRSSVICANATCRLPAVVGATPAPERVDDRGRAGGGARHREGGGGSESTFTEHHYVNPEMLLSVKRGQLLLVCLPKWRVWDLTMGNPQAPVPLSTALFATA